MHLRGDIAFPGIASLLSSSSVCLFLFPDSNQQVSFPQTPPQQILVASPLPLTSPLRGCQRRARAPLRSRSCYEVLRVAPPPLRCWGFVCHPCSAVLAIPTHAAWRRERGAAGLSALDAASDGGGHFRRVVCPALIESPSTEIVTQGPWVVMVVEFDIS